MIRPGGGRGAYSVVEGWDCEELEGVGRWGNEDDDGGFFEADSTVVVFLLSKINSSSSSASISSSGSFSLSVALSYSLIVFPTPLFCVPSFLN